jgi:hypothetical protein
MRLNPVLRFSQHSTSTTSRIANCDDRTATSENIPIRLHQQIYHQLNHLTRRKVIPRRLIRCLIKSPNQILEYESHRNIVYPVRMQIDLSELSNYQIEPI